MSDDVQLERRISGATMRLRGRQPFFAAQPDVRDALIEFVPYDDPAVLAREAATLAGWLPPHTQA